VALWQRDIPKSEKTSRALSGTVFTGETGYKSYFTKVATTGTHYLALAISDVMDPSLSSGLLLTISRWHRFQNRELGCC
jgi:hypothetical protein